jgi:hypothetical protein
LVSSNVEFFRDYYKPSDDNHGGMKNMTKETERINHIDYHSKDCIEKLKLKNNGTGSYILIKFFQHSS